MIQVHSGLSGEEKDETVQRLLAVERPDEPTEIVIHVNMLKEGWDVTNLFTIVPLRAANARTLVEQTIGRGLRLPYGKRTGVLAVDRLTIVAHDKFQEIIDEANRPDSPIRVGTVIIGKDVPLERQGLVVVPSVIETIVRPSAGAPIPEQTTLLFPTPRAQEVASVTLDVIQEFERLPRSRDLKMPAVQAEIVAKVRERVRPAQREIADVAEDLAPIVSRTTDLVVERSLDIPRIIVVPAGEVTSGFRDFNMETKGIRLQPVSQEILVEWLQSHERERLFGERGLATEERPENYLVRCLMDFDDISYDDHADLLYKLAGQVVSHLRSYLANDDEVVNVLQYHQKRLADLVHAQMMEHYEEKASGGYEARVSRGFTTLRPNVHSALAGERVRDFRAPLDGVRNIRGLLFGGFRRCLYPTQRFDSDAERRFAIVLENEPGELKWLKPAREHFQIDYRGGVYEPDFVAETADAKYMCEPKMASEMDAPDVQEKTTAAVAWCRHATEHELQHEGKPWRYLLIPHDAIQANSTLVGLAEAFEVR